MEAMLFIDGRRDRNVEHATCVGLTLLLAAADAIWRCSVGGVVELDSSSAAGSAATVAAHTACAPIHQPIVELVHSRLQVTNAGVQLGLL